MNYSILGRTGLKVSVIGLGAGGHSRLGLRDNKSGQDAAGIVRKAVQSGINLIDTAEVYGTEDVVAEGLQGVPRDQVFISTKYSPYQNKVLKKPAEFEQSVDKSLSELKTDYIDIYHLHGVSHGDYAYAAEELVPEMIKMREKGKIRFLGITEAFGSDPGHSMLERALKDNCWDVMMVGFNILNQSARTRVLRSAMEQNIGILDMFAVRRAFSNPEVLAAIVQDLIGKGLVEELADKNKPLDFLLHPQGAQSVMDAAYRFCRHEPGIGSVLMGTGSLQHLADNIESANKPPLPEHDVQRLKEMFALVDCVSGN